MPSPSCDVTYQLESDDGRQFLAAITASHGNVGVPAGWRLSLRMPTAGAVGGEGWSNDGGIVTSPAQPAVESGTAGRLSLTGLHAGAVPLPTVFQVNGTPCDATVLGLPSTPRTVKQPAAQTGNAPRSTGHGHGKPGKDK
jgi:hypothetical protein